MPELLALDHAHIRHPVELDHPARAFEGMKAVPGIGLILEDQHGAFVGRHFGDHIVQIAGPAQQAQAAGLRLPGIVHIDQHGDQLGAGIGVYLPVARRRNPACRHHGGPPLQVHAQFLFNRRGELRSLDRAHEIGEGGAVFQGRQGKGAGMCDQRKIGIDRRHCFGLDEARHHGEGERCARHGSGFKGFQVDRQ